VDKKDGDGEQANKTESTSIETWMRKNKIGKEHTQQAEGKERRRKKTRERERERERERRTEDVVGM
jgi:hypothetical protein